MKSWKGSYLLLYRVSHFKHICIHSAVLSQTRLRSTRCVTDARMRGWSCRLVLVGLSYLHIHLVHVMLPEDVPQYLRIVLYAGSSLVISTKMWARKNTSWGPFGYINKCRHGCCEWHMVNEKQLKLALANYVMIVGELPPSPPKLYFLSYILKKGIWIQVPCVPVVISNI